MTLTLEITPEVEADLRREAARVGLEPDQYVIDVLEDRLRRGSPARASRLDDKESDLLQRINEGLPEDVWRRYNDLVAKRQAEALTPDEQAELIELSARTEQVNARRMMHLAELARLRNTSLGTVMRDLGIRAPTYA